MTVAIEVMGRRQSGCGKRHPRRLRRIENDLHAIARMNTVQPRDGGPVHAAGRAVRVDLQDCGGAARIFQHPDETANGLAAAVVVCRREQGREIERVAFGWIERTGALVVIEDAIEGRGPCACRGERGRIEHERVGTGTAGQCVIAGPAGELVRNRRTRRAGHCRRRRTDGCWRHWPGACRRRCRRRAGSDCR